MMNVTETVRVQPLRSMSYAAALIAAGWVTLNAVVWQDTYHPAPQAFFWAPAETPRGVPGAQHADVDLVADIQRVLAREGYYAGAIDGVFGPDTEDAILSFEEATGQPLTGLPTPALLAAIELSSAERPNDLTSDDRFELISIEDLVTGSTPVAEPGTSVSVSDRSAPAADTQVARAQRLLADLGYAPGVIDGLMGPQTRGAVEAFQRDRGLVVTGQVDAALVLALESMM
ncbi:MAG: peptidoglycan-binding domain-containing protein [Pseudomonadota bacterium]